MNFIVLFLPSILNSNFLSYPISFIRKSDDEDVQEYIIFRHYFNLVNLGYLINTKLLFFMKLMQLFLKVRYVLELIFVSGMKLYQKSNICLSHEFTHRYSCSARQTWYYNFTVICIP